MHASLLFSCQTGWVALVALFARWRGRHGFAGVPLTSSIPIGSVVHEQAELVEVSRTSAFLAIHRTGRASDTRAEDISPSSQGLPGNALRAGLCLAIGASCARVKPDGVAELRGARQSLAAVRSEAEPRNENRTRGRTRSRRESQRFLLSRGFRSRARRLVVLARHLASGRST
jgi:hypothetical protein